MNFWETITGSDLTREWSAFADRVAALPDEYQAAWRQITIEVMPHGGVTGRRLIPILDGVLGLLETTAADGLTVEEALGDDIPGFCAAVVGDDRATDFRQKWRDQLNRNVARRLSRLED